MKKYFVIGNPIEHSLSPKLHNYWLNQNKIEATYDKKLITKNDLEGICEVSGVEPDGQLIAVVVAIHADLSLSGVWGSGRDDQAS